MWTMTLILCFIGFCATLAWALYSRLSNGATLAELMRTRCQEVFPVRALIWLLFAFACGCSLIGLALLFAEAQALWRGDESPGASISRLIAYLISFALLCASCWWIWLRLAVIGELDPVQVDDGRATFIKGILEDDLSVLGSERFPNLISPEQRMDNIVRWLVLSASAGVLVYFGYQYRAERADVTVAPLIPDALPQSVTAANGIGWFLLVTCGMLLAVSLVENRDYTFVPFRPALALQIGLCGIFLGSLYLAGEADVAAPMGLGVLCGAMGIRAAADLWRWRKYRKTMKVYKPIAETLEMDVPYLDEIAEHPDFRLPDPDQTDLNERIARGCRNIEERSLFVTRSFARFMRLMEVRFQSFAMAMLRYLTVRRYVTTSGGFGTYRMFQCPIVPVWNLRLFPLYPPSGFANLIDPLLLDSEWDIVQTCGRCGGTGQVWETYYETEYYTEHYTEYYTDYNGRQSSRPASRTATRQVAKQRQVTCPACGGSGRVLYRQTLNTQWQSLMPIVTHPRMPMPELVENAEEKSYFHLPLTEDFHDLPPSPNSYGIVNALVKRMEESATYVVSRHTINTEKVEKLHNGKLYRADFQICGFRTISIRFAKLRGRIGWFFGKRPEFYFPRLPLCYATLGTMIFLPPLVVGLAVWMAQVAVTMVAKP